MAYLSREAASRHSEADHEDGRYESTGVDMKGSEPDRDDRFVLGEISEDLPAIRRPSNRATSQDLEDAVRHAVIPRLYAQRMNGTNKAKSPRTATEFAGTSAAILTSGVVETLHRLVLAGRRDAQERFLEDLHKQNFSLRTILEHVVVPVANEIGEAWVDDRMSFADVTLKVGLMQTAVSNFTAFALAAKASCDAPLFLIAPVPGEQHVFGAAVLGNLLVGEGFAADTLLDSCSEDLCRAVSQRHYVAVGLSCNSDRTLRHVADLIRDLRAASLNRKLGVMIGGWALHEGDESLHSLNADLIVTERRSAIEDIVSTFGLEA